MLFDRLPPRPSTIVVSARVGVAVAFVMRSSYLVYKNNLLTASELQHLALNAAATADVKAKFGKHEKGKQRERERSKLRSLCGRD